MNLFRFDYDVTFMVFFMDADRRVYARYGGRDGTSPDARQSLAGLRATMESVLAEHRSETPRYAPRVSEKPLLIHEVPSAKGRGRCLHCHQVREILDQELTRLGRWSLDEVFRYPPPDNLGFRLDVDQSNVVGEVTPDSPAARAGLRAGDRIRELNGVPIHSFGDAQFALDLAPLRGTIQVSWLREGRVASADLELREGWKRTDISWRPSQWRLVALARIYGPDLNDEEREALGLRSEQLAFRETGSTSNQAKSAGIREGDIIIGINDQELDMRAGDLARYVRQSFVVGETIIVNLIRDGQRMRVPMLLR